MNNILESKTKNRIISTITGVTKIRRFLEIINMPKHIKRYMIIQKIERYSKPQNNKSLIWIINGIMLLLFISVMVYIFMINTNLVLRRYTIITLVLLVVIYLIRISIYVLKYEKKTSGITQLILKDDEGRNVKVWDIKNKSSVIIGKKNRDTEVDIDLSGAEYASLISKEHAVINYAGNEWYIEDIGSTNGSGIKRSDEKSKLKVEPGKLYRLQPGDIIYIANTKILAK